MLRFLLRIFVIYRINPSKNPKIWARNIVDTWYRVLQILQTFTNISINYTGKKDNDINFVGFRNVSWTLRPYLHRLYF
jgi:hypothetical protein